jgi:class 3 adenylate cyclase
VAKISAHEHAELVPCSPERGERRRQIADYAQPQEVFVSDEAKTNAEVAEVEFEVVGDVALKGVSTPVRLHRATRAENRALR